MTTAAAEEENVNVGGDVFTLSRDVLDRQPDTLLAQITRDEHRYDEDRDEYVFDRNPTIFRSIVDVYSTGHLHMPHMLCGPKIQAELHFWMVDDEHLPECCWKRYKEYDDQVS